MTSDSHIARAIASRPRGLVALRIVGNLTMRLAAAEAWEFAAFASSGEIVTDSSSRFADVERLRAEVRLQRIAGSILPHVSIALATDARRSLYVLFGAFATHVAILRFVRSASLKPYALRDGILLERFFRQHAETIAASILDGPEVVAAVPMQRGPPLAFTINSRGRVLSTIDEPAADPGSLRAQLLPGHDETAAVLAPVIGELLERFHAGETGEALVSVLPFAVVRLSPLRPSSADALLVTVEELRSRTSLEETAVRYSISKRELQVLSGMLRGASVATIACELSISESTVVFHLKRMLKKTLSRNRTELAARMLGY